MNRQARKKSAPKYFSLSRYLILHWQAFQSSFQHLRRSTLASIMTCGVIGVALALPAVFFVLLQNGASITNNLDTKTQISLFLNPATDALTIQDMLAKIGLRTDVANVHYISPDEGLRDLQTQSEFSNVLDQLPSNPLPPVIEVYPAASITTPEAIQNLFEALRNLPGVDSAKLDMQWIKRLSAIVAFGKQAVISLGLLLALAVILTINHTIRLDTQNRHKEIDVLMLIGATHRFIRRPFLYSGMLYGMIGGLLACLFVGIIIFSLSASTNHLAASYHTRFELSGLSFNASLNLIMLGMLLGLIGSWSAVRQNIARNHQNL